MPENARDKPKIANRCLRRFSGEDVFVALPLHLLRPVCILLTFTVVCVFTLWQAKGLVQQYVWGRGGGTERGAALQTYSYTPNDCGPYRGSRRDNVDCCCRDRSTSWQLGVI